MFSLRTAIAAVGLAGALTIPTPLSDFLGCYADVDRVVFDNETTPTTVQIWGVFSTISVGDGGVTVISFPKRGYLFYRIGSADAPTRAEWADIKAMAGTGRPVGWGARNLPTGRIRPASERPTAPDPYPFGNMGVMKMPIPPGSPPAVGLLYTVPNPVAPAEGAAVPAGRVTLVTKALTDTSLRLTFEIESADHTVERSDPMRVSGADVRWSPTMTMRTGQRYTWRAMTTGRSLSIPSPTVTTTFTVR